MHLEACQLLGMALLNFNIIYYLIASFFRNKKKLNGRGLKSKTNMN